MGVVDVVALQDAEEEDDDVDDRVAHVDIRQVKELAVHWLASLVSEHDRKYRCCLTFSLSIAPTLTVIATLCRVRQYCICHYGYY